MRALAAALVAALAVPAVSAAVPAAAAPASEPAPWHRTDPTGDAPPAADLTRAQTHWEGSTIVIRADVRDLGQTGRFRVSLVDDGETIHVFVKRTATQTRRQVLHYDFAGKHEQFPCKHISVDWNAAADHIVVRAPLGRCVDSGPWGTDGVWLKGPGGAVDTVGKIWWTGD